MCEASIRTKIKNEHEERGREKERVLRTSLLTNTESEHKEFDRLSAATKRIFRHGVEEVEEVKGTPGRIVDGMNPSPGKNCGPMPL